MPTNEIASRQLCLIRGVDLKDPEKGKYNFCFYSLFYYIICKDTKRTKNTIGGKMYTRKISIGTNPFQCHCVLRRSWGCKLSEVFFSCSCIS